METTIKERLLAFIEAKNLSVRQFERTCGFSNGYMRQLVDSPSTDKLNNIFEAYPEINRIWLLAGEGDMLKQKKSASVVDTEQGIPYYEVENFECGTPAGFGGALEATNPDGYFNFPWIKPDGTTFCVKAHGNSMVNIADPLHSINHGSYLALRRSQVSTIQWGEVYALATADGYIVKKLMPSDKEGCVRCVSYNADEYPPFDLNVEEIYDYAIVVGVATINLW